ncbi:MAG: hypothetical protein V4819_24465 [Verrucomicrobiota bacterium]
MSHKIEEFDFGDGDRALMITLPIAPFGEAEFVAPDVSDDFRSLLLEVAANWDALWPDMLERLQDGISGYNLPTRLGSDEFLGGISRMEQGVYMGDRSDVCISLDFEEAPLWDYFIKGTEIVHFQPVF